jgi:hypothetical protein
LRKDKKMKVINAKRKYSEANEDDNENKEAQTTSMEREAIENE